jgi:hypothetical protein
MLTPPRIPRLQILRLCMLPAKPLPPGRRKPVLRDRRRPANLERRLAA